MKKLKPALRSFDARAVQPEKKRADPFYLSTAYRRWREDVCARAGWRCEVVERGVRCGKSRASGHRLFAHHKTEVSDGGAPYDLANGECRCGSHHTFVTTANRAARLGA